MEEFLELKGELVPLDKLTEFKRSIMTILVRREIVSVPAWFRLPN